jgi:hypothetical protein
MKVKAIQGFVHIDKTVQKDEEITLSKGYAEIYTRLGFVKEVQEPKEVKSTNKNKNR